jgi:hypothetical protein
MNYDIGILYRDDMPEQLVLELAQELRDEDLQVETEKTESGPFAALEWAIPAAIILFLVKSYIDTILKEAAKEHYPIIKSKLAKFSEKVLRIKQQMVVSSQSPNKVQKNNPVSGVFAIWSTTVDGRPLKFLFYGERDRDYYAYIIDKIFDALIQHIQEYPNDRISKQAIRAPRRSREIYLLFDDSAKEWKVVDIVTGTFISD